MANKTRYEKYGRLSICNCESSCPTRSRILQFIGLCVEYVVAINGTEKSLCLQQLTGSKLFNTFTKEYCTTETINDVLCYKFLKSKLPFQAVVDGKASTAVFERDFIPVSISNRS